MNAPSPTERKKYPPFTYAPDYLARVQELRKQAWWAEANEPTVQGPNGEFQLPYSVAVRYGLIIPKE